MFLIFCISYAHDQVLAKKGLLVTCAMEPSYEHAQSDLALYLSDKVMHAKFRKLDGNNNGEACQALRK